MAHVILCIDDDPDLLDLVCRAFNYPDIVVIGAPTAEAALAMCGEQRVDLLVTDLELPRGNGVHVIAELRARDPGLPVVVLSGTSSGALADEAISAGASAYLTKPVNLADLRRLVFGLLDIAPIQ